MKKTILVLSTVAVVSASLSEATAGDREWAVAGKVLTGVVAASVLARAIEPAPVCAPAPVVYQTVTVAPPAPVVYAAPAPVVYSAPAPVVYAAPAPVVYAAPATVVYAPAPVYMAPAPVVVYSHHHPAPFYGHAHRARFCW